MFPGTLIGSAHSIGSMIVLWIAVSVGIGRGWCSWTCFYGGWEDGFSRLAKRPRIRHIPSVLRYAPYAVLAAMVSATSCSIMPTSCMWLCPFKSVSEFVQVLSPVNIIQTVLFIALFATLVVVFPFLTKKRTQCSYFCPFGAMQGFVDKIECVRRARGLGALHVVQKMHFKLSNELDHGSFTLPRKDGEHVREMREVHGPVPSKGHQLPHRRQTVGGASGTVARTSFLFFPMSSSRPWAAE